MKRSDLSASRHDSGDWVIKDPIALRYAMLDDAEYATFSALDGETTFAVMLEKLQAKFPGRNFSPDDLASFLQSLAANQLIRQVVPGEHSRLYSKKSASPFGTLLGLLVSILRLQLPLFNPNRVLQRCLPSVRFLFGKAAGTASVAIFALAASIAVLRFGEIRRTLPDVGQFLGPQNIFTLLVVFVVVKMIHEAGHAFTARHFGAECNECGVMLLVLTPVLYTNVTDSWTLPRHQRMMVTAAGIWVELLIASVCVLLWSVAADGPFKSLLLNTMLLCSLNTLLFNGNPLLRFDGYFLVADAIGIPNLASRASVVLRNRFIQLVTGISLPSVESKGNQRILLCYGVLAAVYRVLLTIGILRLLQDVGREWQMEFASNIVSMSLIIGSLLIPMLSFAAEVIAPGDQFEYGSRNHIRMLVSASVGLLILLVPLPDSIVAPATVETDSGAIYARLPGAMTPLTSYGQLLKMHQPIAVLKNPELLFRKQKYEAGVAAAKIQIEVLLRDVRTANSESIPALQKNLAVAERQLAAFEDELLDLTILSARKGTFVPPPARKQRTRRDLPMLWHDTPAAIQNHGAWIERGTLLGYVVAGDAFQVVACINEKNIEGVAVGQKVEFFCKTSAQQQFTGEVTAVGRLVVDELPETVAAAGVIGGEPTADGFRPKETSYNVTVAIELDQANLRPAMYSVGHVRIAVGRISLLNRMLRFFQQTF